HGIEYTFYEAYLEKIDTPSIDSVYVCGLEIEEYTGENIIAYLKSTPNIRSILRPVPAFCRSSRSGWRRCFPCIPCCI
ncbi:MAG: carbohydrate kinase family protein, partial [Bacillota bacterium]|nr:carbohydrate kinase family protein [Bacillota bacterium]